MVSEELPALERRTWTAMTSDRDAEAYYDDVLSHDMVMVLPGMVLERSEVLESWCNSVPWRDFEIADAKAMHLGAGAALLTYRAKAWRAKDVASYRALCTSVYRRVADGWQLTFQQQTPLSNA